MQRVLALADCYIASLAIIALIRATKYERLPAHGRLSLADLGATALWVGLLGACSLIPHPVASVMAALAGSFLVLALWLDAVLFAVFTIELGPGGVGDIVLSMLASELGELRMARRFFGSHLMFALLPVAGVAVWWRAALGVSLQAEPIGGAALLVYLIAALAMTCSASPGETRPGQPNTRRPSLLRDFFLPRSLPRHDRLVSRSENRALLELSARPWRPSRQHGALRGQSVVLVTLESVGRDHLNGFAVGQAGAPLGRLPWLEALVPKALVSGHHFCVSPTTNNAHMALYAGRYQASATTSNVRLLSDAGYRTVYLSTARAAHYGLGELLVAAGFAHILERESFSAETEVTDYALLDDGMARVRERLPVGEPFFLHVHTTHTHLPYRVVDAARFSRFDSRDDYGRFLNGIEETGAIVEALFTALHASLGDFLLVVTSDHGQSFGELGYFSHGSAVTKEQLNVPFLLHHPSFAARAISHSSHFDVLPTILDLLGVPSQQAGYGDSLLHDDREPALVVWAGHPSRTTTSNYGVISGKQKLMIDLIRDTCYAMDWNDGDVRELGGEERELAEALATHSFLRVGLK